MPRIDLVSRAHCVAGEAFCVDVAAYAGVALDLNPMNMGFPNPRVSVRPPRRCGINSRRSLNGTVRTVEKRSLRQYQYECKIADPMRLVCHHRWGTGRPQSIPAFKSLRTLQNMPAHDECASHWLTSHSFTNASDPNRYY
jgi:hypothetical protein